MENMALYDTGRAVPREACKPIGAGRLKGMTNINPMWRIRKLTEMFGPAGIGWYTEEIGRDVYPGADGEMVASLKINLYVKAEGEWSKPIFGEGGSLLVAAERTGLHTSDEAFKMAYTDALSVACKALGIGADIYFAEDRTKYDTAQEPKAPTPVNAPPIPDAIDLDHQPLECVCERCGKPFQGFAKGGKVYTPEDVYKMAKDLRGGHALCKNCYESKA